MRHSFRTALAAFVLAAAAQASVVSAQAPEQPQACQRACLEGFVDSYLQAMADGKVDPALFAPTVRFTENGVEMPLGNEGLWATTSGLGTLQVLHPRHRDPAGRLPRHGAGTGLDLRDRPAAPARAGRPVAAPADRRRQDHRGRADRRAARAAARRQRAATPSTNPFPATGAAVEAMGAPNARFLAGRPREPSGMTPRRPGRGRQRLFRGGRAQHRQGLLPVHRRLPAPRERHHHRRPAGHAGWAGASRRAASSSSRPR